ncbi:hypothetical protein ABE38_24800 [Brevibacillus agri]|nr:hypothetical protein [Brevibacillus agri]
MQERPCSPIDASTPAADPEEAGGRTLAAPGHELQERPCSPIDPSTPAADPEDQGGRALATPV